MTSAETLPSEFWRRLSSDAAPSQQTPRGLDAIWNRATGRVVGMRHRPARYLEEATRVRHRGEQCAGLSDDELRSALTVVRERVRLGRAAREDILEGCALVSEVAVRTLGLRPHVEQAAGALAIRDGCVAEMATGEGKTLTASLATVLAAWGGRGCHVLTFNAYLAARDAESMKPIYDYCGLRVASIDPDMAPPDRRNAYQADITYCTNQDVAADFLRDRLALGRRTRLVASILESITGGADAGSGSRGGIDELVLRGLDTAIVDEVDSVLIDEAVTPLIISGEAPNNEQVDAYSTAARIAGELEENEDFAVNPRYREVGLTRAGRRRVEQLCGLLGGLWDAERRREELIEQALTARLLFQRDEQYVLDEEKVVIVDESTGRLMPDRTWRAGLHQAVEAKEGLEIGAPKETLARISFQRFFRMYRTLGGTTGTGWEAHNEMWQIYGMPIVVLPTHQPCLRKQMPDRHFADADAKWAAVIDEIERVHGTGRPILVGTRSVDASESVGNRLAAMGIEHQVLNAVRHAEEAAIVARAGERGRVTVATNMAGRGTDIKLGSGVKELGGLHVIATERHESVRIDRQLFGRAARQGDPGSAVAFVSLDDELCRRYGPRLLVRLARRDPSGGAAGRVVEKAQARASTLAIRQRQAILRTDDWLDHFLGFAGHV